MPQKKSLTQQHFQIPKLLNLNWKTSQYDKKKFKTLRSVGPFATQQLSKKPDFKGEIVETQFISSKRGWKRKHFRYAHA